MKFFAWHQKGDYFATVVDDKTSTNNSVMIHQLSKQKSLIPFQKLKGLVQQVKFHPSKPIFFVAVSYRRQGYLIILKHYYFFF